MFKHYLKFVSLGQAELYEICEPIGFDGAEFILEQESKRYARDVSYGAIDKLTFIDALGDITTERVINQFSDVSNRLDYGLQWLLYGFKLYGFEFKVEYYLSDGIRMFEGMNLDFTDKDITDGYSYVSAKLIQQNKVANVKRRLDDKFNLFSDKNAKQETITPASTINFLLKATPIIQTSVWEMLGEKNFNSLNGQQFNPFMNLNISAIANSLVSFENITDDFIDAINNFKYIIAKNSLSNGVLTLDINAILKYRPNGSSSTSGRFVLNAYRFLPDWSVGDDVEIITIFSQYFSGGSNEDFVLDGVITALIPDLRIGESLAVFWEDQFASSVFIDEMAVQFIRNKMTIKYTSTSLNTVAKGIRWIDAMKQASKFTEDLTIDAELFEESSANYNNVVFNRAMISQKTESFTTTPKIIFESIEELNCDYELSNEKIFIGHQQDFYENEEIGVFQIIPAEGLTISENDRCMINKFKFGYKTFDQDRDSVNTSQAIHTESENIIQNENVENVKEVKLDFVRDPFAIQDIINLEISKPTTSTDSDDKVYINEIVELSPSSSNTFSSRLLMKTIEGRLQILNRDSNGDEGDVIINWLILGFGVGSAFEITAGGNIGVYTVHSITNSVLTLTPVGFTPSFNGDSYITMFFYYTNVSYTSRTNEGFTSNPLSLQNVNYSIKRNIGYFGQYLKSCLLYSRKDIINSFFKSNGVYKSQLNTEIDPLIENGTITFDSLPDALITSKKYDLTVVAEFQQVIDYLDAYKIKRGFVRCYDLNGRVIKGFVQKLNHGFANNELVFTIEQKFETEFLTVNYSDGQLVVNDIIYNLSGFSDWYIFQNDYLKFYDNENRPICNDYRFNFVILNGTIYDTKEELVIALEAL